MEYDEAIGSWVFLNKSAGRRNGIMTHTFIHPLISLEYVTSLLFSYADNGPDEFSLVSRMLLKPEQGGIDIAIVGGVKISPNLESGMEEFLLYATNKYGDCNQQRFDCVQISYDPEDNEDDFIPGVYDVEVNKPFCQVSHMFC